MQKLKFYHYFIFLYCFFPFTFRAGRVFQLLLSYGLAFVYVIFNFPLLVKKINSKFILNSVCLNLLVFASLLLIPSLITLTNDFGFLFQYIASYRSILLILCISVILIRHGIDDWKEIAIIYIRTLSLYVLFSLILLIPNIHKFWMNIIFLTETNQEAASGIAYYTRFGLQGFSGWGHTILCSIAVSLFWLLKIKGTRISYLYYFLCLVGCAMYGRSGLLVSMMISLIASIAAFKYRKIKYFMFFLIIGVVLYVLLLLYMNSSLSTQYNAFSWILEPFLNILKGNKSASSSSDVLKSMYENFHIEDVKSLLIGEGRYTGEHGHYYKSTDVGFMRPLYFGGLLFETLYYTGIFLLFLSASKSIEKKYRKLFIFLLGISFLVFELKGESYFMLTRVLLLFCFKGANKENINDISFYNKPVQSGRSRKSFFKYCFSCKQ